MYNILTVHTFTHINPYLVILILTEADQDKLQSQVEKEKQKKTDNGKQRAAPNCRKCGKPWKGHPRGSCV